MNESFAIQGFSGSNTILCFVDGDDIFQTDYTGSRVAIGKTAKAYKALEETTTEYYNKLVELGVIVPPKTPEEQTKELQETLSSMADMMKTMQNEIKELKQNGHQCTCEHGGENVSKRKNQRSSAEGATDDRNNS